MYRTTIITAKATATSTPHTNSTQLNSIQFERKRFYKHTYLVKSLYTHMLYILFMCVDRIKDVNESKFESYGWMCKLECLVV